MTVDFRQGDCRDVLRTLPDQSVHCCVTSPPYFGLRDYGTAEQIGLERTAEAFVSELVTVFREVRRVLRDDGTLWLNLGDSYNAYNGNRGPAAGANKNNHKVMAALPSGFGLTEPSLKSKDLIGIPWLVAFALRADGWYLRQDIIWHKPNPMPESVTDRCTKAHEYVFMLTKSPKYYFDNVSMQEPATGRAPGNKKHKSADAVAARVAAGDNGERTKLGLKEIEARETRNRRSVWTVATSPFKEAHFATFPPALIEPCILAGCPLGGTVLDPFGGAGTTGLVATQHARNAILIELNPEYIGIAQRRIYGHKMPWEPVHRMPWE